MEGREFIFLRGRASRGDLVKGRLLKTLGKGERSLVLITTVIFAG
jgi:hypothetical protein